MTPKHITLILGVFFLMSACGSAPTKAPPTAVPAVPSATIRPTATATRPAPTSTASAPAVAPIINTPRPTSAATMTARPTLAATPTRASSLAPRTGGGWQPVGEACPADAPIKGNINSKKEKIYHRPRQQAYDNTKPEACFRTAAEAEAAGFRAALR